MEHLTLINIVLAIGGIVLVLFNRLRKPIAKKVKMTGGWWLKDNMWDVAFGLLGTFLGLALVDGLLAAMGLTAEKDANFYILWSFACGCNGQMIATSLVGWTKIFIDNFFKNK